MHHADPRYGKGAISIEIDDLDAIGPDELIERLLGVFTAPGYKPPMLPGIALELLGLTRDPNVGFDRVTKLIEREPMLAARILQVSQSALYGGNALQTMNDALIRLGLKRVTEICFEVSLGKVFRAPGYEPVMEALRQHAVMTAHVTREVCRYTWVDAEYAFLGGLLHDIGFTALLIALANRPRGEQPPPLDPFVLKGLIDAHERAGEKLAELWGLPADIRLIISNHHHFVIGGHAHPVAAAVNLADLLVGKGGFGGPDFDPDRPTGNAVLALQLSDEQLALVMSDAQRVVAEVSGQCTTRS